MAVLTNKQKRDTLIAGLKELRSPYEPTWLDIAQYDLPERMRLNLTDQNRGERRNNSIYNSTVLECIETFESGFMTAATDPSTRWFNQTVMGDPDRAEFGPVKRYLDGRTQIILDQIDASNMYQNLPTGYGNEATFGLFAMSIEETLNGLGIHTRIFAPGSFWIAQDDESNVHTFYTEHRMTVRQIYEKFPRGQYSLHLKDLIDKSNWEEWVDVGRLIYPNEQYKPGNPMGRYMRFKSCWFEVGCSGKQNGYKPGGDYDEIYLNESGFDDFPVMVGRWSLTEGDVYPNEYPGLRSLGDTKSLQIGEKRSWQGIEKLINPHWLAPEGLRGTMDHGFLPGGTSYVPLGGDFGKQIMPAHIMDPRYIEPLEAKMRGIEARVKEAFHYNTFRTFDSIQDKPNRTATEIIERKAEKLLTLVKMYVNNCRGVLRPGLGRIDRLLEKQGHFDRLGPVPDALAGSFKDWIFNGVLAQAQRMNRVQPNQTIVRMVAELAAATPDDQSIWDKINRDQALDVIATDMGCDPSIIRSDEDAQAMRDARAQAQQQAQQMAQLEQASKVAGNLGKAQVTEDTALGKLAGV